MHRIGRLSVQAPVQGFLWVLVEMHHLKAGRIMAGVLHAGLRALQSRKELEKLVKKVKATRDGMPWSAAGPPPLLVKIAPDITDADKSDIAAVALKLGIDGLIVSNTTICRPPAVAEHPEGQQVCVL